MNPMEREISNLLDDIVSGKWAPRAEEEHWGGAGLIVNDEPFEDNAVVVVTRHAGEVSSLIMTIRDRMSKYLDYLSKEEFYTRIGEAANRVIAKAGDEYWIIFDGIMDEIRIISNELDKNPEFDDQRK